MTIAYPVTSFGSSISPSLPLLALTPEEQKLITDLQFSCLWERTLMREAEAYYLGRQIIDNLRIAIPQQLEFLRTLVGWPSIAVDPLVERLSIDGFRLPNATDADGYLGQLWEDNGLEAEQALAFTDALSLGSSYWVVGAGDDGPRITVESPLNLAVKWDTSGRNPIAALQEFWQDGARHATLMVPGKTITVATDASGQWQLVDRDEHGFDFVPVSRMANRPRTSARSGLSEITPAIRSLTDSACRTLLGLEVARELYSVPQRVILGAVESDFVEADGTAKSGWDTYVTKVLGLERDEEGNLPELKQLQPYDPSVFTKLIDMYASQAGALLAAPPQDLGLYTSGNPVSAEAAQVAESRRNLRARLKQKMFGVPMVNVMKMAVMFEAGGRLPAEFSRISVDWDPLEEPSISLVSDGLSKQVAAGMIPPTSDVTLKRAGYSSIERARLEQDRRDEAGRNASQSIVDALNARTAPQEPTSGPPAV